jgi:hypothetical protein
MFCGRAAIIGRAMKRPDAIDCRRATTQQRVFLFFLATPSAIGVRGGPSQLFAWKRRMVG